MAPNDVNIQCYVAQWIISSVYLLDVLIAVIIISNLTERFIYLFI